MSTSARSCLFIALGLCLSGVPLSLAQESTSYRLSEHVFNAAGHPEDGTAPASADFRLSLDAVGEALVAVALFSTSYRMDAGLVAGLRPPGEVVGLRLSDARTLVWAPEFSASSYNLYRGPAGDLASGQYGACLQDNLVDEATTDDQNPPVGQVFFYLVTAENRLDEEGSIGQESTGGERPNLNACP